jgi:beta-lactamase class D
MKYIYLLLIVSVSISACTRNNVQEDPSLKQYFDRYQLDGCFGLWNNATNEYTLYNRGRYEDSLYSPASTFKIVNLLIGLETGAIESKRMKLKWDGVTRPIEVWNQDLTLDSAFRFSAVWYFQEVARRVGPQKMKVFIDSLQYGNRDISGPVDSFWLNNKLKIRPDEQLGLMKQVYFEKFSFFNKEWYPTLKQAMLMESTDKYKLYYKTGLTATEQQHPLGWVVGWIEIPGATPKVHFFVLNVEGKTPGADIAVARLQLLKDLLKQASLIE